jgi:hypothetical protein
MVTKDQSKGHAMTEHGHNFIREIAEAYRALEQEPELHHRIKELEHQVNQAQEHNQALELRAIDRTIVMEELRAKVREAEVARDDAELRFLELDEKAGKALAALGNIQANLNDARNDLAPPKPEPVPEPVVDHEAEKLASQPFDFPSASGGEPVVHPLPVDGQDATVPTITPFPSVSESTGEGQEVPQPLPTAPQEGLIQSQPVSSTSAETETSAPSHASQPERNRDPATRFTGRRYYDVTYYVPYHAWIEGGGTAEDYNWRPPSNIAAQ